MSAIDWISDNWEAIAAALGSLYTVVTIVVALTPTPEDDAWLRRIAERLSFLSPPGSTSKVSLPGAKPKRPPPPVERVTLPEADS